MDHFKSLADKYGLKEEIHHAQTLLYTRRQKLKEDVQDMAILMDSPQATIRMLQAAAILEKCGETVFQIFGQLLWHRSS